MAKKSAEQVIREARKLVLDLSELYLERLTNREEVTKDEKKHLKELKTELKFVEDIHAKLHGKVGKDLMKGQEDILASLKNIESSIGGIVKSIPKN